MAPARYSTSRSGSERSSVAANRLEDGRHAHGFADARAHVAHAELERRVVPARPHVPPNLGPIGNAVRFDERFDETRVGRPRLNEPGNPRSREVSENDAAVRLEPGVPSGQPPNAIAPILTRRIATETERTDERPRLKGHHVLVSRVVRAFRALPSVRVDAAIREQPWKLNKRTCYG